MGSVVEPYTAKSHYDYIVMENLTSTPEPVLRAVKANKRKAIGWTKSDTGETVSLATRKLVHQRIFSKLL